MKRKVCVLFTCYNRCETTIRCVKQVVTYNKNLDITIIAVDDNSTDGTQKALEKIVQEGNDIHILHGNGDLYWCGGMRKAIAYAKILPEYDYYVLVNDDVDFYEGIMEQMIAEAENDFRSETDTDMQKNKEIECNRVLVGATCDSEGNCSYGGVRYIDKGVKYKKIGPQSKESCHTFNANCVLIPKNIFIEADNIDETYIHTLGDFDFGLSLYKKGYEIKLFSKYVGICNPNSVKGTWCDKSLSIRERIRKKEQPKGAPFKQWFHFLKKNFGFGKALVYGCTPYMRILLGK